MAASRISLAHWLAWGSTACLALGIALSVPGVGASRGKPVRALLVDVSADAVFGGLWSQMAQREFWDETQVAASSGEDVIAIAFGRGARRFPLEQRLATLIGERGEDASDLAAALALCRTIASERVLREVVILGEGTWTGVDPATLAAQLAAQGVGIRLRDPHAMTGEDVGVAPLNSPIRVRRGEPISIEVEAWRFTGLTGGHHGPPDLAVTAVLREGEHEQRRVVRIPPYGTGTRVAPNRRSFRVPLEFAALSGASARLEVRADLQWADEAPSPGDIPENDAAAAEVITEGTLVVGVSGDAANCESLRATLSTLPEDLSLVDLESLSALARVEVIVTADDVFHPDDGQILAGFVSAGGGWLDLAGFGFTGGVRPAFAALQRAPEDSSPREIVVLVDASGSMAGEPSLTARAALARLVELAPVSDGLSALWFSAESSSPVDLGRPGERSDPARKRAVLERIASAPEARGPTRLWAALEALADAEADRAGQRRTLAIVVTDGRDPERADFAARADALRAKLAAVRTDLAVVAAGSDPDRELLAALADGPTRVLDAGDLMAPESAARLAEHLQRAASHGAIVEDVVAAGAYVPASEGPAASLRELAPPILRRYVRARARDGAQVAWSAASSRADTPTSPLLAFARHGLGQVAGLAFLPDSSWVREPNELGAALVTTLRAIAPPADARRPRLVERDGDLVLEDVGDGTPAIVRAKFASERGEPLGGVDLVAARAGHDPLRARSARLPSALADLAAGERVLVTIDMGTGSPPLQTSFVAPRASEFARLPGVFEPPRAVAKAASTPGYEPHPAAPAFLLLGLLGIASAAFLGLFSRFAR